MCFLFCFLVAFWQKNMATEHNVQKKISLIRVVSKFAGKKRRSQAKCSVFGWLRISVPFLLVANFMTCFERDLKLGQCGKEIIKDDLRYKLVGIVGTC